MSQPQENEVKPNEPEKAVHVEQAEVQKAVKDDTPGQAMVEKPIKDPNPIADVIKGAYDTMESNITFSCNNASECIFDVQGDQRFPTIAIVSKVMKLRRFITELRDPRVSEMSLTGYSLLLYHFFNLFQDIVARRGVSHYAEPLASSDTYTLLKKTVENAYIPTFLADIFTGSEHFISENKNTLRYVPTYACFDHNTDFGRFIPAQLFLTAHDILATSTEQDYAAFVNEWTMSPIYNVGNASICVGNLLTYNMQIDENGPFNYENWFNHRILEMARTSFSSIFISERTLTPLNIDIPNFIDVDSVNPYILGTCALPANVHMLTSFIASMSLICQKHFQGIDQVKKFVKTESSKSNITFHWYSNYPLMTCFTGKLEQASAVTNSLTPNEFAELIRYKYRKPEPNLTDQMTSQINVHDERLVTLRTSLSSMLDLCTPLGPPPPTPPTEDAPSTRSRTSSLEDLAHLEITVRELRDTKKQVNDAFAAVLNTRPRLGSSRRQGFDANYTKSDYSAYPLSHNYSLFSNPKSEITLNGAHTPQVFNLSRDYMPDVKYLKPYKPLQTTALSLTIANGFHIETEEIDGIEIPVPNPNTALVNENGMFFKDCIPIKYLWNPIAVDHFHALNRVKPKKNQPISLSLYDAGRNAIPRIPDPFYGHEDDAHAADDLNMRIDDYTHYLVHRSNKICYFSDSHPNVPPHYFKAWSSYRTRLDLPNNKFQILHHVNQRLLYGTLIPMTSSKFPSTLIPE